MNRKFKKYILIIFAFLINGEMLFSQPEINVTPERIDFVYNGGIVIDTVITITNTGNAPLEISSFDIINNGDYGFNGYGFTFAGSPPGIDEGIYHLSARTIEKGESYTFTVHLKRDHSFYINPFPKNYLGFVTITHNATGSSTNIQLNGEGIYNVVFDAGADNGLSYHFVDFGDVNVGSQKDTLIRITNVGTVDKDGNVHIDDNNVHVRLCNLFIYDYLGYPVGLLGEFISINKDTIVLPPSGSDYIHIRFSPTESVTYFNQLIFPVMFSLSANTSPRIFAEHSLRLIGRGVIYSITVDSASLDFGNVNIGSSVTKTFTITNTGTANLIISSLNFTGADAGLFSTSNALPIHVVPSDSTIITVTFLPTSTGTKNAQLSITHNVPETNSTVKLFGNGVEPKIMADRTSMDFGNVDVGDSSKQSMKITNIGTADLRITNITITGDGFTYTPHDVPIIKPSESVDIMVRFLPETEGEKEGVLNIIGDAGILTTVHLSGTGIITDVKVSISKGYKVKPGETITIQVNVDNDLRYKNARAFSFILRYNKRILSIKETKLDDIVPSDLFTLTKDSKPGELRVEVTNSTGVALTGKGSLIDVEFIGLLGDSCGTHLILEVFEFNSDGPSVITEDGYCELFGRCGGEQTYVTTETATFLYHPSPNPIQEGYHSNIQYKISKSGEVKLTVYDVLGREVAKLVDEYKSEGLYSISFNTKGLPSGVYFYKLRAPGYEGLKKMVIVK